MNDEIEKMIERLRCEIVETKDEFMKTESMERLRNVSATYRGEDEVVNKDETVEKVKNEKEGIRVYSTFKKLDEILKGFRPQQLITVSAATKSGKTSFMMDLTSRMPEQNVLWFPFEESAEELVRKFLERGENPPDFCTPKNVIISKELTVIQWVEMKIVESIVKFNTKVVIIDHLDYVIPFSGDNHSLRMSEAMRSLKGLAKKWNVIIFVICHLVKTRMEMQPTIEDLRGSSSIAQESDTVILLWRETFRKGGQIEISNNLNVSVQANRATGKTGNVKMTFIGGKFYEKEWETQENGSSNVDF